MGREHTVESCLIDRLAEVGGRDRVGFVEEEIEVGWGGRVGEPGQGRVGERGVPSLPFLPLRLQPITKRHQPIHLRDDPLLLGERRRRNGKRVQIAFPKIVDSDTSSCRRNPRGVLRRLEVSREHLIRNCALVPDDAAERTEGANEVGHDWSRFADQFLASARHRNEDVSASHELLVADVVTRDID